MDGRSEREQVEGCVVGGVRRFGRYRYLGWRRGAVSVMLLSGNSTETEQLARRG